MDNFFGIDSIEGPILRQIPSCDEDSCMTSCIANCASSCSGSCHQACKESCQYASCLDF